MRCGLVKEWICVDRARGGSLATKGRSGRPEDGRGLGLLCLTGVLLGGASTGRSVALSRVLSGLRTCSIATTEGDLCSSVTRLGSFNVGARGARCNEAIRCGIVNEAFRLTRLGLLISSITTTGFVARRGSGRLVGGLRDLADERRTTALRHRMCITKEIGAVGDSVVGGISTVRGTVTGGSDLSFRCYQ